ncbi:MAG TPA: hypothetical protein VMW51_10290, partial [Terriglobia bacterium]|nr:hypothetical protein [Terriglobia bacterium]
MWKSGKKTDPKKTTKSNRQNHPVFRPPLTLLTKAAKGTLVSVRFSQRAQIVLLAAEGRQDIDIARKL